jgi:hypothetical protein
MGSDDDGEGVAIGRRLRERIGTDDAVVAPGLLSISTVWPSRSCNFCVTRRAVTSVKPRGG